MERTAKLFGVCVDKKSVSQCKNKVEAVLKKETVLINQVQSSKSAGRH